MASLAPTVLLLVLSCWLAIGLTCGQKRPISVEMAVADLIYYYDAKMGISPKLEAFQQVAVILAPYQQGAPSKVSYFSSNKKSGPMDITPIFCTSRIEEATPSTPPNRSPLFTEENQIPLIYTVGYQGEKDKLILVRAAGKIRFFASSNGRIDVPEQKISCKSFGSQYFIAKLGDQLEIHCMLHSVYSCHAFTSINGLLHLTKKAYQLDLVPFRRFPEREKQIFGEMLFKHGQESPISVYILDRILGLPTYMSFYKPFRQYHKIGKPLNPIRLSEFLLPDVNSAAESQQIRAPVIQSIGRPRHDTEANLNYHPQRRNRRDQSQSRPRTSGIYQPPPYSESFGNQEHQQRECPHDLSSCRKRDSPSGPTTEGQNQ